MRATVEREVKLVPGEGFQLPTLGQPQPERDFVSTYLDTPDLRLARSRITLRLRVEDGAGVWQLKLPSEDARHELEVPGPPARPPSEFLDLLVAYLRGTELVRVARLRTRRQSVRADGVEIADDSVAVMDGQRVTDRFRELEIELLDGDEEALERVEKTLRDAGAVAGDFTPKLYRVLDLAYPPEHARAAARRGPGRRPPGRSSRAVREAARARSRDAARHGPGGPAPDARRDAPGPRLPARGQAAARPRVVAGAARRARVAGLDARPRPRSRRPARASPGGDLRARRRGRVPRRPRAGARARPRACARRRGRHALRGPLLRASRSPRAGRSGARSR